jgi:hypothetical protein
MLKFKVFEAEVECLLHSKTGGKVSDSCNLLVALDDRAETPRHVHQLLEDGVINTNSSQS